MITKIYKTKIIKMLSYLLVFLSVTKYYLYSFNQENPPVKYFILINCLLSILLIIYSNKYNLNYLFILFTIASISFITGNGELIYSFLIIMAVKELDVNEIIKIYFISNLIYFILIIILNNMNIIPSKLFYTSDFYIRNDLGFGNPNRAFLCFYLVALSYIFIRFENYNLLDRVLITISSILMYNQTLSRTGFITLILTMIMIEIIKKIKIDSHVIRYILKFVPIYITGITLFIGYFMDSSIKMNSILSKRPLLWNNFLTNKIYKINLIGYDNDIIMKMSNGGKLALDNAYIYMLFKNGIIIFGLILILYIFIINNYAKNNMKKEIVIIISILIFGFSESTFLDVGTNFSLFLIYPIVSKASLKL